MQKTKCIDGIYNEIKERYMEEYTGVYGSTIKALAYRDCMEMLKKYMIEIGDETTPCEPESAKTLDRFNFDLKKSYNGGCIKCGSQFTKILEVNYCPKCGAKINNIIE